MNILISLVLGVIAYFVLMYISTNLIGLVVRGIYKNENDEKESASGVFMTIVAVAFTVGVLYFLYDRLSILFAIAAALFMIGRIPDLLWEIKHGVKTTKENMRQRPIDYITGVMDWIPLPLLCYAIYQLLQK